MRKLLTLLLLLPALILLTTSCGKDSTSSSNPVLAVTPGTLGFGATRSVDTLQVTNSGSGTLTWSAAAVQIWITLNPDQGSLGAGASTNIVVTVDRSVIPQGGDYTDDITFTSNGGTATVAVTMHKSVLKSTPPQIDFESTYATRQLVLTNESDDTLNWQGSADETYLGVSPDVGTLYDNGSVNLTVSADRALLVDGAHTGNFYFYAGAESLIVPATLEVTPELSLGPDSLLMSPPDTDYVFIGNDGYGTLDWDATYRTEDGGSWLSVTPLSGVCTHTTTDTLTVVVESPGLISDEYVGWVVVTTDDGTDSVKVQMGEWVFYDDGSYENAVMLTSPGYLLVRFNDSGDGAVSVSTFMIHVSADPEPIQLCGWSSIYSGGFIPDSLLYESTSLQNTTTGNNYFNVSDWDFTGSFFVGYYQPDTLGPFLSVDTTGTPALRSYFGDETQWYYLTDANFAIRAYVVGGGTMYGGGRERELRPEAVYFLPSEDVKLTSIDRQKLIRLWRR
jgi:hypothetical protein